MWVIASVTVVKSAARKRNSQNLIHQQYVYNLERKRGLMIVFVDLHITPWPFMLPHRNSFNVYYFVSLLEIVSAKLPPTLLYVGFLVKLRRILLFFKGVLATNSPVRMFYFGCNFEKKKEKTRDYKLKTEEIFYLIEV